MKNNYYRRIDFYMEDDIIHSEYYDITEPSYINNVYKVAKRLSYMYAEDIVIVALDSEELYSTDRIYIYYEDVKNMVDDLETQLYNSCFYINSRGDFMSDSELYDYMEDAMEAQQALYDITGKAYDCFADKE